MATDEHELPVAEDAAAERLARLRAAALRVDTQPSLLAAARRLRQRLPGDEKFGDPLSTAGVGPAQIVARQVSSLRSERESVAQELGLAGLQIWQSLSEAAGRGRGATELALLFTDLVGFSSWALEVGDAAALELLRSVDSAVEAAVLAHGGVIVKRLGDGSMARFDRAQDAIEAALEAQHALEAIEIEGYRPRMRAGVHWGCPRRLGGDYLGVDVNIAARVCDAAKAGEVLVSNAAIEQIDTDGIKLGRSKRLRADGAPRETQVRKVSKA